MTVTGIEISRTAIEMARKHYGNETVIYHGSVTEMPFDNEVYDGVFCYALIHLLDGNERERYDFFPGYDFFPLIMLRNAGVMPR